MSLATNVSNLATRVATEFKAIRTLITGSATGTLTGLTTTDKTSVVASINEVKAIADSAGGGGWTAVDASETVKGIVELATTTEVTTGTDTTRAVTPAGVTAALATVTIPAASEAVQGKVELATLAEVAAGTDTTRAVTAAGVRQERNAVKAEILDSSPATLDTLNELAAALGDDPNFATSTATALGNRVRVDAAQGLTAPQQLQGRQNIDAASATDVGDTTTNFVTVFEAGLV